MPHFQHVAPGRRCVFAGTVALTAALTKPTRHYKNRDFPPSDAAHPIFERITGSILERIGEKKHPIIEHNSINIYIYIYIHLYLYVYIGRLSRVYRQKLGWLVSSTFKNYIKILSLRLVCIYIHQYLYIYIYIYLSIGNGPKIRFRGVRFQTPSSVSSLALTELRGENSVNTSEPTICVQRELIEFFAELTEFAPKNSLRNSISPNSSPPA